MRWETQLELAEVRGPQACKEAGTVGFSGLGHPGATGSHKRAENKVGACRLNLAQG